MVKTSEVFKRSISVTDSDFNIGAVYKNVKIKVDALGYVFFEKEQAAKPAKYGDEVKFTFAVFKNFDDFAMGEINIEFFFTNLVRSKNIDHGNANINIKAVLLTDYKNDWGKKSFNKLIFEIYSVIKKSEFKVKYSTPLYEATAEIYDTIKTDLGLETA